MKTNDVHRTNRNSVDRTCLLDVVQVDDEASVSQSSHEGLKGAVLALTQLRDALQCVEDIQANVQRRLVASLQTVDRYITTILECQNSTAH